MAVSLGGTGAGIFSGGGSILGRFGGEMTGVGVALTSGGVGAGLGRLRAGETAGEGRRGVGGPAGFLTGAKTLSWERTRSVGSAAGGAGTSAFPPFQ